MSSIFGPPTDSVAFSSTTYLQDVTGISQALIALDTQITNNTNNDTTLQNEVNNITVSVSSLSSVNVYHSYLGPSTASGFAIIDTGGTVWKRNLAATGSETWTNSTTLSAGTYNDFLFFNNKYFVVSSNLTTGIGQLNNFTTLVTVLIDNSLTSVNRLYIANNLLIAAVNSNQLAYSTDGTVWVLLTDTYDTAIGSLVYFNGLYYMNTDVRLYTTSNIATTFGFASGYDPEYIPEGLTSTLIINATQLFYGPQSSSGNGGQYTTDGVTWNTSSANTWTGFSNNPEVSNSTGLYDKVIGTSTEIIFDNYTSGTIFYNGKNNFNLQWLVGSITAGAQYLGIFLGSSLGVDTYEFISSLGNFGYTLDSGNGNLTQTVTGSYPGVAISPTCVVPITSQSTIDYIPVELDTGFVNTYNTLTTLLALEAANEELRNDVAGDLSNVYTKSQSNALFYLNSNPSSYVTPANVVANIGGNSLNLATIQQINNNIILGNNSGSTGNVTSLTSNDVSIILDSATDPFARTSVTVTTGTSALTNYYTKTVSDGLYYTLTNPSNYQSLTDVNGNSTLTNYYTKTVSDGKYYLQTNPANYIDSSALSGYLTSATAASTYATLTSLATTNSNVSTNTTNISNLTSNTANGSAINTNALALSKIVQINNNIILGNQSGSLGNVTALSADTTSLILDSATNPFLRSNTASSTYYLSSNPNSYQTLTQVNNTSSLSNYYTKTVSDATYATASALSTTNSNVSTLSSTVSALSTNVANGSAIGTNVLSLSQLQTIPDQRILGNNVGSTSSVISLTPTQISTILDGSTNPFLRTNTAASTYATLTQLSYLARPNVLIVQTTGGSTTPATGQSYSTVASALAAATSNNVIYVMPGTYNENSLTIPAGVCLRGICKTRCIISSTVSSSTTIMTVGGAGAMIGELTLAISTSTNGCSLTGVTVGSTYNSTFELLNMSISLTSSSTTTDNNICFNQTGTGVNSDTTDIQYRGVEFDLHSSSTGMNRAVYVTGTGSTNTFDSCSVGATRTAGAGTNYIAFECNASSAICRVFNSELGGTVNDVSQTLGTINLGKSTILSNSTTNGLPFSTNNGDELMVFMDNGTLGAGTSYAFQGTFNSTYHPIYITRSCVITNLYYNCSSNSGGDITSITVLKNGSATTLTCSLATSATTTSDTTHAVTFAAGDLFAIQFVRGLGVISNSIVQVLKY